MGKYRKIPVVIEAVQWLGDNADKIEAFLGEESPYAFENDTILIATLEGVMTAALGDWIIRGVNGEFYPCKPDIFAKTYQEEAL